MNYAPDTTSAANYNNATGAATETVQAIAKTTPAVTVTPSPKQISVKQALTVTVTLNGGLGNPSPSGTVTLTGGGFTSVAVTLSGGSASIPIPEGSLSLGSDTLTANLLAGRGGRSDVYERGGREHGDGELSDELQCADCKRDECGGWN